MTLLTSAGQMKMEVLIVGYVLNARPHDLLCSGVCLSSRVWEGICKGVHCIV
jgi:hypothetical protein